MKKKLNIDFVRSISEFEGFAKYLEMKNKLYRTLFRGKGPIFDGFRDYTQDDDAEYIDWKTSLRAGKIIVKKYKEERALNFVFVVDASDGMVFGSGKKLKCEYAGEVMAAMGKLILESGDRLGLLMFNGKVELFVPPSSKPGHLNYILSLLSNPDNYGGHSNFSSALDYINNNFTKKINVLVFFSDFTKFGKEFEKPLNLISSKFETMAMIVRDRFDKTLPDFNGEIIIEDPNTYEQMIINPRLARRKYEKFASEQESMVMSVFSRGRIDTLELITDKPFVVPLVQFLEERTLKRKEVIL